MKEVSARIDPIEKGAVKCITWSLVKHPALMCSRGGREKERIMRRRSEFANKTIQESRANFLSGFTGWLDETVERWWKKKAKTSQETTLAQVIFCFAPRATHHLCAPYFTLNVCHLHALLPSACVCVCRSEEYFAFHLFHEGNNLVK